MLVYARQAAAWAGSVKAHALEDAWGCWLLMADDGGCWVYLCVYFVSSLPLLLLECVDQLPLRRKRCLDVFQILFSISLRGLNFIIAVLGASGWILGSPRVLGKISLLLCLLVNARVRVQDDWWTTECTCSSISELDHLIGPVGLLDSGVLVLVDCFKGIAICIGTKILYRSSLRLRLPPIAFLCLAARRKEAASASLSCMFLAASSSSHGLYRRFAVLKSRSCFGTRSLSLINSGLAFAHAFILWMISEAALPAVAAILPVWQLTYLVLNGF